MYVIKRVHKVVNHNYATNETKEKIYINEYTFSIIDLNLSNVVLRKVD